MEEKRRKKEEKTGEKECGMGKRRGEEGRGRRKGEEGGDGERGVGEAVQSGNGACGGEREAKRRRGVFGGGGEGGRLRSKHNIILVFVTRGFL